MVMLLLVMVTALTALVMSIASTPPLAPTTPPLIIPTATTAPTAPMTLTATIPLPSPTTLTLTPARLTTANRKELNTMYEFRITKLATGEESIIFGYDMTSAFRKAKLNPAEWVVWDREYID